MVLVVVLLMAALTITGYVIGWQDGYRAHSHPPVPDVSAEVEDLTRRTVGAYHRALAWRAYRVGREHQLHLDWGELMEGEVRLPVEAEP